MGHWSDGATSTSRTYRFGPFRGLVMRLAVNGYHWSMVRLVDTDVIRPADIYLAAGMKAIRCEGADYWARGEEDTIEAAISAVEAAVVERTSAHERMEMTLRDEREAA